MTLRQARCLTVKFSEPILDHVFHDDDADDEVPEAVQELMKHCSTELIEDLLQIGFHVGHQLAVTNTDEDDPVRAGLLLAGWVGDIAFSDRVLRPQVRADEEILAEMDDAEVARDYESLRKGLLGDA